MEWILFLSIMFVLMFLIMVAFLYIWRPSWLIIDDGINNPDIDMWGAFLIGLASAMIFVGMFFIGHLCRYKTVKRKDCEEKPTNTTNDEVSSNQSC